MIFLDAPRLSAIGERMSTRHLHAQVKDPALREKLLPHFQFGCKRILISDDYWASFERENVELVTEPIEQIVADGVQTKDGELHELDVIVFATGFALGLAKAPFPVIGRGGRSLDDAWRGGAVAYKGMTVAGFPNWFILMGPNTGPGHTSVLIYTEAQISHTLGAIRALRREGWKFVDVRQDVQDRYNQGIQGRMKHMVWSTAATPGTSRRTAATTRSTPASPASTRCARGASSARSTRSRCLDRGEAQRAPPPVAASTRSTWAKRRGRDSSRARAPGKSSRYITESEA